jgi:hypothetical protein
VGALPLGSGRDDVFHLEAGGPEERLFEPVATYGFCMTTMHPQPGFRLKKRVVCVLPFRYEKADPPDEQRPWVVVQLWPDDTPMLQFYSRLPEPNDRRSRREQVIRGAERVVELLGGERAGKTDPHSCRWEHYEQWPYFGHVGPEDFARGFFRDLEALQGHRNTYWVGGFTNFELIEAIVCYSKAIVETHFAPAAGRAWPAYRPRTPRARDAVASGARDAGHEEHAT